MHKKLAATLTIAIFLISTFAIMVPVQAHFTLGENTATYPYHVSDFDPHVDGVIGYVWPGGGENVYTGGALFAGLNPYTTISNILPPGYVPPYPTQSLNGAFASWPQNYAQLDGHEYSPFGAIVVNTSGDLIFALNASNLVGGWSRLYIAIPPEFKVPGVEQIVTTITNNYANIYKYKASMFDRYVPGWTVIRIDADVQGDIFPTGLEWYYVRVNGVTAPSVAGKYFFKMYLANSDTSFYWVPTQNWPVLLVKGELDPAIITGTIRFGGYNSSLYGMPMQEAGMVKAVMKTKLDPYTNAALADCTKLTGTARTNAGCADAVGYFNSTAGGHYEVEGVAPGVYDLYAEAAGYPLSLIAPNVQVLKGQSLHFDGYLNPGPVIHGDVFSKHAFGSEPWPSDMYIKIELYGAPTKAHVPNASAGTPVSWSPLPCIAMGQDFYRAGNDADYCPGDPRTVDGGIAFPWFEWNDGAGGVYQSTDTPVGTDPQGVGPGQTWYVQAGDDTFHYEFGAKGMFGAPRDLDGHVPQVFATWVNGLTAGRYYVRAWVFRYVQSALDGATFEEYSFDVGPQEWAGDISLPLDLRLSSWVNKTVHFHNNAGTLQTSTINTGAEWLVGDLYATDAAKTRFSYNQTRLTDAMMASGTSSITFYGLNDTWLGENYGIPAGTYRPAVSALGYLQQTQDLVSVTLSGTPIYISNHLYRGAGFNITVYSIDWERPRINRNWVWNGQNIAVGVFATTPKSEPETYDLAGDEYQVSTTYFDELEGTGVNINPNDGAQGVIFGSEVGNHRIGGTMSYSRAFTTSSATNSWKLSFSHPSAIDSGLYYFQGWTYGYIQNKDYSFYVNKGQVADIKINMIIGVNITVDILFKKEHLISGTPNVMSGRVRVFDAAGMLVATWMSSEGVYVTGTGRATAADGTATYQFDGGLNYLPGGVEILHVLMAGLPMGPESDFTTYGDPVFTPGSGDFEIGNWPAGYWSLPGAFFPNQGILGTPDYTGAGWTVEVDFVNWYLNGTALGDEVFGLNSPTYYPIVPGLLMGESFHIIPGTAAKSKISLTEDGATNKTYVSDWNLAHSMAPNHLGPYSQKGVWSLPSAHLSGEISGIWEVDLNGYLSGTALAFTWSNELRTLSWYTVTMAGANMTGSPFISYTNDGIYEFFLTPGTYSMTLAGPGYKATSMGSISVTDGQTGIPGSGVNIGLPPTNIPIPEFSGIAIVAFSALAASLYLLRRRRR